MLKLIYSDDNFSLERLTQSLETWVGDRMLVSVRAGQDFYLEPSTASFLISVDMPVMVTVQEAQLECANILDITPCDGEYFEICLQGIWVTETAEDGSGIFVCVLGDRLETLLSELWQSSRCSYLQ